MEIFENDFTVTFTNSAAANKAKQLADESFRALRYDLHSKQPSIRAANSLTIEDDVTLTFEEICFDSLDLLDASSKVIKALAYAMKEETFEFYVRGSDTYTDGWIEGNYLNGVLDMTNIYRKKEKKKFLLMDERVQNCTFSFVRLTGKDRHNKSKKI